MSVRNGERVTEIGDQTFLDTKEGTEKESEKGGGESECAPLWSERARRRHGVSQRTEKVISIGFARGGWEEKRRRKEGKGREREGKKTVERRCREKDRDERWGPDGSERDGVSEPEECLSR